MFVLQYEYFSALRVKRLYAIGLSDLVLLYISSLLQQIYQTDQVHITSSLADYESSTLDYCLYISLKGDSY